MPYNSDAIANWFLDRAEKDKAPISPMKLQKLIYYAHGWHLALLNAPLIKEHPEAWDYGPVIPSIYHEFKKFGSNPISIRATRLETSNTATLLEAKFIVPKIPEADEQTIDFLERIWEVYGPLSGIQLSNMTHDPSGAWHKATHDAPNRKGTDIPDDLIKAEFLEKLNASSPAG